ncbi:hypothetical protein OH76DRAFT_1407097 [Lentinus brumalis]|uniref:SET domain-containing protein n=1 Tax=Lentinus brumalis TaxID=2498619 RepID=A0A371D1E7_9APHY|nr:hypothetical protein OH76DRAFT_1407097 [Polyporus brumalis]
MHEQTVKTMYPENQDFIRTLKDWKSTDKATFHPVWIQRTCTRDISRVNHSCCANAHVAFELETLTFTLRAVLPILKGQEATCSSRSGSCTERLSRFL